MPEDKKKKCPSCRNQVPIDAVGCPFCPYSFPVQEEIDVEQVAQQQSWSPLPLMLGLGAAAVVAGLWMTIADSGSELLLGKRAPVLSLKSGPAQPPLKYDQRPPAPEEQPAREDPSPAVTQAARAPSPPKEWKMRGVVYDLLTLEALSQCRIVFRDDQANALLETVTDAAGRYRMILPPLDGRGYAVSIHKAGYAASYLNPGVQDVPMMSRESRANLARGLIGAVLSPVVLEPPGAAPLVTDFYLAPEK